MKVALITGASSGIGKCFAQYMDTAFSNIDEFWLVARNEDKLKELAATLKHKTRIFPLDITQDYNIEEIEFQMIKNSATLCMLINCAGYGIMGEFTTQDRDEMLGMIRLNCEALSNITHRLIRYMAPKSRIIQLASSAGFLPQPDFAVYAATKAYVLHFSKALAEELYDQEIYVTAVCPGPVDTPFFDIAERNGKTLTVKKYTMVEPIDVVKQALYDSYRRKTVSVPGKIIKLFWVTSKMLPNSVFLRAMKKLKKREQH